MSPSFITPPVSPKLSPGAGISSTGRPHLIHVADSPAALLGYPASSGPTSQLPITAGLYPPSAPAVVNAASVNSTAQTPASSSTASNLSLTIPVPDYVWQQLLTVMKSSGGTLPANSPAPFLDKDSAKPLALSSQHNRHTPHPSGPMPKTDIPALDDDSVTHSDKDFPEDDESQDSSRKLVRRFENQLVDFIETHPAARQRLDQMQDRINDLLSNPDSAAESLRYEYQHRHPLLKWSIRIARPLIYHEINQLPEREDERAPFLNRQFVLNLFNFVTESDRQHRARQEPLLSVG